MKSPDLIPAFLRGVPSIGGGSRLHITFFLMVTSMPRQHSVRCLLLQVSQPALQAFDCRAMRVEATATFTLIAYFNQAEKKTAFLFFFFFLFFFPDLNA